jgi:hypothetical protein
MEKMAGPSGIVFPLRVAVLERLWGQQFDGLNYENESLLFSWRYNPLWLYFHSPVAGFSLLVFEVS